MNFLNRRSKNPQIINNMKILPEGAQLFRVDGRTDRNTNMMQLVVALRNYANALKIGKNFIIICIQILQLYQCAIVYKLGDWFLIRFIKLWYNIPKCLMLLYKYIKLHYVSVEDSMISYLHPREIFFPRESEF
jgi:hypothetical protein